MKRLSQIILIAITLTIVLIGYLYQARPSADPTTSRPSSDAMNKAMTDMIKKQQEENPRPNIGETMAEERTKAELAAKKAAEATETAERDTTAKQTTAQATPAATKVDPIDLPNLFGLNPLKAENLFDLIAIQIPKFLLSIVAALTLLFFLISAARMLLGASSPDEAAKAKQGMTWAIIGMVLAVGSYAILRFIETIIKGGN